jgi:hypothetical protein
MGTQFQRISLRRHFCYISLKCAALNLEPTQVLPRPFKKYLVADIWLNGYLQKESLMNFNPTGKDSRQ